MDFRCCPKVHPTSTLQPEPEIVSATSVYVALSQIVPLDRVLLEICRASLSGLLWPLRASKNREIAISLAPREGSPLKRGRARYVPLSFCYRLVVSRPSPPDQINFSSTPSCIIINRRAFCVTLFVIIILTNHSFNVVNRSTVQQPRSLNYDFPAVPLIHYNTR